MVNVYMRLNNLVIWAYFSLNSVNFTCLFIWERQNKWRWAVKEESDRAVRRINGKITALKQEAEKQPWFGAHRDGASELFRAIRESCAQIVERWSADFKGAAPKPTWQLYPSSAFGRIGVRSSLCQGGDMGRLEDSYKTGAPYQRLYGRPCRLLFLLRGVFILLQMPALALHRWFCSDGPCLLYLRAALPNTVLIFFFIPSGLFLILSVFVLCLWKWCLLARSCLSVLFISFSFFFKRKSNHQNGNYSSVFGVTGVFSCKINEYPYRKINLNEEQNHMTTIWYINHDTLWLQISTFKVLYWNYCVYTLLPRY